MAGSGQEATKRLRAARGYAGLTQPGLGKLIGVSESTVKRFEKNPDELDDTRLRAIARVCEVPYEFLTSTAPLLEAPGVEALDRISTLEATVENFSRQLDEVIQTVQEMSDEAAARAAATAGATTDTGSGAGRANPSAKKTRRSGTG